MATPVVARNADALLGEVDRVAAFIGALDERAWEQPTRCPPLTVRELLGHMLRGAQRVNEMIDKGPLDEQPQADAITYWRVVGAVPNAAQPAGPSVVQSAQQTASGRSAEELVKAWHADWETALSRARSFGSADPVLQNPFAKMRMGEYLRTRCVEVVVHHMDVRDAVNKKPDPHPAALSIVSDVLSGLLGTDARRLGFDETRLALLGTGRATLTDAERGKLGPLARGFPLIV